MLHFIPPSLQIGGMYMGFTVAMCGVLNRNLENKCPKQKPRGHGDTAERWKSPHIVSQTFVLYITPAKARIWP